MRRKAMRIIALSSMALYEWFPENWGLMKVFKETLEWKLRQPRWDHLNFLK